MSNLPLPVLVTGLICVATVLYSAWIVATRPGDCPKIFAVLTGSGAVIMLLLLAVRVSAESFVDSQIVGPDDMRNGYGHLRQLYDLFSSAICLLVLRVLCVGAHHHLDHKE